MLFLRFNWRHVFWYKNNGECDPYSWTSMVGERLCLFLMLLELLSFTLHSVGTLKLYPLVSRHDIDTWLLTCYSYSLIKIWLQGSIEHSFVFVNRICSWAVFDARIVSRYFLIRIFSMHIIREHIMLISFYEARDLTTINFIEKSKSALTCLLEGRNNRLSISSYK